MLGKVLVTHPVVDGGLDPITPHYDVTVADGLEDPVRLKQAVRGLDALLPLLTVPVTAEVLEAADRLQVVANHAVGYDNVDLEAATRLGILVTNTPGVLTEATADLTWALLLAAVRRVPEGEAMMRAGEFTGWEPQLLLGADLQGKTLGIVGLGQIGEAVARRAAGFGMRVLYHDTRGTGPVELGPITATGVSLERLLAESDIVSLHVPLTPETRHLLDAGRLSLMKPTAYLINTSRGPVVDERALVAHLQAGRLAGAGLDVYEDEPRMAPGLRELRSVVLLPHLGSATRETRRAMARTAAENIHAALQGRRPPNLLNPEALASRRG